MALRRAPAPNCFNGLITARPALFAGHLATKLRKIFAEWYYEANKDEDPNTCLLKLRQFGENAPMEDGTAVRRGAILGALTLYLDFINLFLMMLRLFGGNRE